MDPILIEVPEAIHTERLLIAAPRAGLGPMMSLAIAETFGALNLWMPWAQQVPSIEEAEATMRRAQAEFILRKDLVYQFYDREAEGRRLLGGTGLHRIDWAARRFEIGYWVRASAEGKGYVSEAVRGLAEMAFGTLQARRVEIRMDENNVRSRAVAERCGFELEAVLKNDSLTPAGEPRSTCIYIRLA